MFDTVSSPLCSVDRGLIVFVDERVLLHQNPFLAAFLDMTLGIKGLDEGERKSARGHFLITPLRQRDPKNRLQVNTEPQGVREAFDGTVRYLFFSYD